MHSKLSCFFLEYKILGLLLLRILPLTSNIKKAMKGQPMIAGAGQLGQGIGDRTVSTRQLERTVGAAIMAG
jgi:hypothetical protein